MAKFAKLVVERAAEKIAVRHIERAVAESMICTRKGDDPLFARGQHGGFERGFDGFKTGIAENDLSGDELYASLIFTSLCFRGLCNSPLRDRPNVQR